MKNVDVADTVGLACIMMYALVFGTWAAEHNPGLFVLGTLVVLSLLAGRVFKK